MPFSRRIPDTDGPDLSGSPYQIAKYVVQAHGAVILAVAHHHSGQCTAERILAGMQNGFGRRAGRGLSAHRGLHVWVDVGSRNLTTVFRCEVGAFHKSLQCSGKAEREGAAGSRRRWRQETADRTEHIS